MGYGSGSRDAKKSAPTHRSPQKTCGFAPRAAPGFADGGFVFNGADPMYADNSGNSMHVAPATPNAAPIEERSRSYNPAGDDETGGSRPAVAASVTNDNPANDDETGGSRPAAASKPAAKAKPKSRPVPSTASTMKPRSATKMSGNVPSAVNPNGRKEPLAEVRNSPGNAYNDAIKKVSWQSIKNVLTGKKN